MGLTADHPLPADGRCPVCGIDEHRLSVDDALDTIRTLGRRYREAVRGVPPDLLTMRPPSSSGSMLDYVVHVRDVLQVSAAALDVVLESHHPRLGDLEGAGVPAGVDVDAELEALDDAARALAERGARTSTLAWDRPFDLDGVEHPARWIVQHAAHEGAHHLRDLDRVRRAVAPVASDD